MLSGRCCRLLGLGSIWNLVGQHACGDKQNWFLAETHHVVCGNRRQYPFAISVSPHDCKEGVQNLVFILRTPSQRQRKLISIFIGNALSFSRTRYSHFLRSQASFMFFTCTAKRQHDRKHCLFSWNWQGWLFWFWFPNFLTMKVLCADTCLRSTTHWNTIEHFAGLFTG